jgi:hypothetical protein
VGVYSSLVFSKGGAGGSPFTILSDSAEAGFLSFLHAKSKIAVERIINFFICLFFGYSANLIPDMVFSKLRLLPHFYKLRSA